MLSIDSEQNHDSAFSDTPDGLRGPPCSAVLRIQQLVARADFSFPPLLLQYSLLSQSFPWSPSGGRGGLAPARFRLPGFSLPPTGGPGSTVRACLVGSYLSTGGSAVDLGLLPFGVSISRCDPSPAGSGSPADGRQECSDDMYRARHHDAPDIPRDDLESSYCLFLPPSTKVSAHGPRRHCNHQSMTG